MPCDVQATQRLKMCLNILARMSPNSVPKNIFTEENPWEVQYKHERKDFAADWNALTAKPYSKQTFLEKVIKPYRFWLKILIKRYERQHKELQTILYETKQEVVHHEVQERLTREDLAAEQKATALLESKILLYKLQYKHPPLDLLTDIKSHEVDIDDLQNTLESLLKQTKEVQEQYEMVHSYSTLIETKLADAYSYQEKRFHNKRQQKTNL